MGCSTVYSTCESWPHSPLMSSHSARSPNRILLDHRLAWLFSGNPSSHLLFVHKELAAASFKSTIWVVLQHTILVNPEPHSPLMSKLKMKKPHLTWINHGLTWLLSLAVLPAMKVPLLCATYLGLVGSRTETRIPHRMVIAVFLSTKRSDGVSTPSQLRSSFRSQYKAIQFTLLNLTCVFLCPLQQLPPCKQQRAAVDCHWEKAVRFQRYMITYISCLLLQSVWLSSI